MHSRRTRTGRNILNRLDCRSRAKNAGQRSAADLKSSYLRISHPLITYPLIAHSRFLVTHIVHRNLELYLQYIRKSQKKSATSNDP